MKKENAMWKIDCKNLALFSEHFAKQQNLHHRDWYVCNQFCKNIN